MYIQKFSHSLYRYTLFTYWSSKTDMVSFLTGESMVLCGNNYMDRQESMDVVFLLSSLPSLCSEPLTILPLEVGPLKPAKPNLVNSRAVRKPLVAITLSILKCMFYIMWGEKLD